MSLSYTNAAAFTHLEFDVGVTIRSLTISTSLSLNAA